MKISIASWQQEHSLFVFGGQALSRKFSEWGTPHAVSSLDRRTLFYPFFQQNYSKGTNTDVSSKWSLTKRWRGSFRNDMYNSCAPAFQSKKSLLKRRSICTWLCASDSLWLWLWDLLEARMKPRHPGPRGMLAGFYILSLVCMKENSKLSLTKYSKELNWGVLDIIRGLDTHS